MKITPENVLNIYGALLKIGKEQGCEDTVLKLFENKFVEKFIEKIEETVTDKKSEEDEKIKLEEGKNRFLKEFKSYLPEEVYEKLLEFEYTPEEFPDTSSTSRCVLDEDQVFTVLRDKNGIHGIIYHSYDFNPYFFHIKDNITNKNYWFEKSQRQHLYDTMYRSAEEEV